MAFVAASVTEMSEPREVTSVKMRKNRSIERDGVNAVRALFEGCGYVFQEVELGNDYGKDAYVDLVEEKQVTGLCVAMQIKSGEKYRRVDGYAIPIEGHEEIWRHSTLPVAGVVHDAKSGKLYWCSVTSFLAAHPKDTPTHIPVSEDNVLTADTLEHDFKPFFRALAKERLGAMAVLQLCSDSENLRNDALLDCFATGRFDPRFFIVVRHLLPMYTGNR